MTEQAQSIGITLDNFEVKNGALDKAIKDAMPDYE